MLRTSGLICLVAFTGLMPFSSALADTARGKVVYGADHRQDVADVRNPLYLRLASSTAAIIPSSKIRELHNGIQLSSHTLASRSGMNVCSEERFANQITAANCSGFLVGPDLLVTAGHCIEDAFDCRVNRFVFDFHQHLIGPNGFVPRENVFSCRRIVSRELNNETGLDYAVIQLDREVTGRAPLKVRRQGQLSRGVPLVVIGHPSGLPTKIADGARVRSARKEAYFVANLDTFGGNSGSAVFNSKTGEVEGILVRGATDYRMDYRRGCLKVKHCLDFLCRGEDVTKITQVPIPALD